MTVGIPLLDALLASLLGERATFSIVDPEADNDLGLAIAVATQFAGSSHRVIWVENGPAAMLSLAEPEPGNVVVSDRTIEYASRIRETLLSGAPGNIAARIAKHTFLTVVADEALQQGHTDLAVNAIAMSVLTGDSNRTQGDDSGSPSGSRLGAFATWCYGLLHELGHLADLDYGHLTTDENLLKSLDWAFRHWMREPRLIGDACERAVTRPDSVIGLGMLRSEVGADLFATDTFLEAAVVLMDEAGQPFDWQVFIREQHAAQQAVVIFDRLKRAVRLGVLPAPTYDHVVDDAIEMSLQPLSIAVRNLAQQEFIVSQRLVTIAASGYTLGRADVDRERRMVHDCIRPLESHYQVLDDALDMTVDFIMSTQRHIDQQALLERISSVMLDSSPSVHDVVRFLNLAESLGRRSHGTVALRALITSLAKS